MLTNESWMKIDTIKKGGGEKYININAIMLHKNVSIQLKLHVYTNKMQSILKFTGHC